MNDVDKIGLDSNRLQALAKEVLDEAAKAGAEAAEVNISANKGYAVKVHNGSVETIEYHKDKSAELQVYFGKRTGGASVSDLRPESIKAAVAAACHIAKFTDEDKAAGLAEKDELAFNYKTFDLASPWDMSVDNAIELGLQCEREALAMDKRIGTEEISVGTGSAVHVYANSKGFLGHFPFTRHEIVCVLVAKDKDGMQRDYYYTVASDPSMLTSVSDVAKQAVKKTISRLGGKKVKTTKVPVIYIAEEARGLIGHFASAMSGGHIFRKTSFLVDQLHKKVFPDFMQIQEFPHKAHALGSAPFDGNGVQTRENKFIEDGILQNYALSVYSARMLGMKTTGNAGGTHNLTVKTGNKNLEELIKTMNKGLIITEMMGQGVNILTGDYSRGASGFWVENGEIQYPVHEVTVAGKLPEMFSRIAEVGNDVDLRGNVRTGSILIEEMTVAGE